MKDVLAYCGALLVMLSSLPYIIDILRHRSKPNIVTWLVWTILTGIACAAAFAGHETHTALFTLGSTFGTAAIVLLGIRHGIAKFSLFDICCLLGALAGLVLWQVFNSPTIGIVVPVIIDFVGLLPTLKHSWQRPHEETWLTYFIDIVAPLFTIASLNHFNTVSLLYPAYIFFADLAVLWVLAIRHSQVAAD